MTNQFSRAIEIAEKRAASENDRRVLVSLSRFGRIRNVKLYRDNDGVYVRTGKRGQCKRYLNEASDATVIPTEGLPLVHFYGL